MKSVVNEPQAVYERVGWQTKFKSPITVDFTCGIENETVIYRLPGSSCNILPAKPKGKLSALRGKLTKQRITILTNKFQNYGPNGTEIFN